MSRIKGTVTRAMKGKFGWSLQLDSNDLYYNTKFEPKCGEGDVVGIEFESKGEKRANIQKVKIFEDNSGGYSKANSESSGSTSSPKGSTGAGGDRNQSIVYQSSRKDALVLTGLLLANEAFAIKGKADAKRVQIEELIQEITDKYYAAALAPVAPAKAEEEKSEDDWDTDDADNPDADWD